MGDRGGRETPKQKKGKRKARKGSRKRTETQKKKRGKRVLRETLNVCHVLLENKPRRRTR